MKKVEMRNLAIALVIISLFRLNSSAHLQKFDGYLNRAVLLEWYPNLNDLSDLTLLGRSILKIDADTFQSLINLTSITIVANPLKDLPPNLFRGLNLNSLSLSNNYLDRITNETLFGISSLSSLDLSNNAISDIDIGAFSSIQSIDSIDLEVNGLKRFDARWFTGCQINYVNLYFNLITTFDDSNFETLDIGQISLNNNFVTSIKPGLFKGIIHLDELHFSYGKITKFVEGMFYGLETLKVLWLSASFYDCTEILVDAFPQFPRLEVLSFDFNGFYRIYLVYSIR